ncbi:molybdopterin-dependent oxidoreductase [Stygiolobus caldivivus]|uniref:Oxidoreductase n=1 Tax=Stygiolobus caldivivus TaxID=2824673 RepID=A0A8D5U5Z5_9CREN|nr:molybdopterin-dependent oxidoreductase [Stygiolobus caldivivus]BCU69695.1 oxidoreductase [Stygiolobus caldivivus]
MPSLASRRNFLKAMVVATSLIALWKLGSNGVLSPHTNKSLTPFTSWYVVQYSDYTPSLSLSNYVLTVDGQVNNPLQLTYQDLTQMPSISLRDTIQCVSDSYFLKADVEWTGVPLKHVLNMAEVKPNAIKVVTFGADGYTADLPLYKAMEEDTLIVYKVDGKPLPGPHGYPVRLAVPRWWGYCYTKWLVRIHVTDKDYLGYWESRGYPDVAKK